MATEVITRKWGNSIGVILPNELIQEQNIRENQKIILNVVKEADISHLFGSLKGKLKMSGQKLKDVAREGWD